MRRVVSTETVSATYTLSLSISNSEPIFAHLVHLQHISQVYWKVDPVQQNVSGIIFIHQDVWDFPSKCQTQYSQFPSKSSSSITTITFTVLEKPSKKKPGKQMWQFWPFPLGIWFFDAQNTFHFIFRGLKNAFFVPFPWLPIETMCFGGSSYCSSVS